MKALLAVIWIIVSVLAGYTFGNHFEQKARHKAVMNEISQCVLSKENS